MTRSTLYIPLTLCVSILMALAGCSRLSQADLDRIIPVPRRKSEWKELDQIVPDPSERAARLQETELLQRERQKLTEKIQRNIPEFKLPAVEVAANPLRPISDSDQTDASPTDDGRSDAEHRDAGTHGPRKSETVIRLKSEWPDANPAIDDGAFAPVDSSPTALVGESNSAVAEISDAAQPPSSEANRQVAETGEDESVLPSIDRPVDTPWPSTPTEIGLTPLEGNDGNTTSPVDTVEPEAAIDHDLASVSDNVPEIPKDNATPDGGSISASNAGVVCEERCGSDGHSSEGPVASSETGSTEIVDARAADESNHQAEGQELAQMDASVGPMVAPREAVAASGGSFEPLGTAVVTAEANLPTATNPSSSGSESTSASEIPVLSETPSMSVASTSAMASNVLPVWKSRLLSTIESVQDQIIELDLDDYRRPALQRSLTMLMAIESQLDEQAMAMQSPERRAYWDHQITAILNVLRAPDSNVGQDDALLSAIRHLEDALAELKNQADLRIAAAEFCSEVSGFGQFRTMEHLNAGRPTLIYCEVENYKSLPGTQAQQPGFLTRLKCRVQLQTPAGEVVQDIEYPVVEDIARHRRRDFYLHLPLIVEKLPAGEYQMVLTIEDLGSGKTATLQSPRSIEIR